MPSRSALAFMARNSMRAHIVPSPGYEPELALVHRVPIGDGRQSVSRLLAYEGDPVPDRVVLPDWSVSPDSEDSGSVDP